MKRPLVVALLAMALVLAACADGEPVEPNPRVAPEDVHTYVALGDSYTSGPGISPATGDKWCQRSKRNYPALLAERLDVSTFRDVSCAGAPTDYVLDDHSTPQGAKMPSQLSAVAAGVDLVTIGIGDNDFGLFTQLFYSCLDVKDARPALCSMFVTEIAPKALRKIGPNVVQVLEAIRAKAPHATVVLVGYLRVLSGSVECDSVPISLANAQRVASVEKKIEKTLGEAASEAGVEFVAMRQLSDGHQACAGEDAWVNGNVAEPGDGVAFHPRASGMEAVANAVMDHLRAVADAN